METNKTNQRQRAFETDMEYLSDAQAEQGYQSMEEEKLPKTKTFKVLLTRYPEEFEIEATSEEEARKLAKSKVNYSVWESEVEEDMGRYKVLISKYPEEFEIEATSEKEAVDMAKEQANFSVWESEVEEIEVETTSPQSIKVEDGKHIYCTKCGAILEREDAFAYVGGCNACFNEGVRNAGGIA